MKLRWTRRALRDLREIHAHIARDDPTAALEVARAIRARTEALCAHPRIGRPGRVSGTRELVIAGLPYLVAYRLTAATVDVLAVRHAARLWPDDLG